MPKSIACQFSSPAYDQILPQPEVAHAVLGHCEAVAATTFSSLDHPENMENTKWASVGISIEEKGKVPTKSLESRQSTMYKFFEVLISSFP